MTRACRRTTNGARLIGGVVRCRRGYVTACHSLKAGGLCRPSGRISLRGERRARGTRDGAMRMVERGGIYWNRWGGGPRRVPSVDRVLLSADEDARIW